MIKVSTAQANIKIPNLCGRDSKYTKQEQIYKMEKVTMFAEYFDSLSLSNWKFKLKNSVKNIKNFESKLWNFISQTYIE